MMKTDSLGQFRGRFPLSSFATHFLWGVALWAHWPRGGGLRATLGCLMLLGSVAGAVMAHRMLGALDRQGLSEEQRAGPGPGSAA